MRLKFSFLGWMLMLLFFSMVCHAQLDESKSPVKWLVDASWIKKDEALLTITAILGDGCYLYAQAEEKAMGPVPPKFEFNPSLEYTLIGSIKEEQVSVAKFDPLFGKTVSCYEKAAVYTQRIKLNVLSTTVKGTIFFMMGKGDESGTFDEKKFKVKIKMKEVSIQGSLKKRPEVTSG